MVIEDTSLLVENPLWTDSAESSYASVSEGGRIIRASLCWRDGMGRGCFALGAGSVGLKSRPWWLSTGCVFLKVSSVRTFFSSVGVRECYCCAGG